MSDEAPPTEVATIPRPRLPWEQREGESLAAFNRFTLFRNLGPCRSVALAVANAAKVAGLTPKPRKRKKPTKAKQRDEDAAEQSIERWYTESAKYEWTMRAEEWDRDCLFDTSASAFNRRCPT